MDEQSFGFRLKQYRKAVDLTQAELAGLVGCSKESIRKIEANRQRPSWQIAERLAQHLNIPLDEHAAFARAARAQRASSASITPTPAAPAASWQHGDQSLSNLPRPATPLIGREQELAALCDRLLRDDVRLLTLSGAPGVGKTRLGIQVAAKLQDAFADGVAFVALAAIRDPDLVVSTIAQTLGLREAADRPLTMVLREALRDKQVLLLLDTFEHVLAAAPVLAELLVSCPRLKLLLTSRAALQLSGEHTCVVPPLALPDHDQLLPVSRLGQYAAVALFVQRAQALTTDFVLTAANARTVAAICIRLDGLPLAIELAAARSKLFSPQALLRRLSDSLDLLTSGPQDLPARQRTLRDAIAWSYELLDASEQALLRRLAVFVGGGTLLALGAVCNVADDLAISLLDGVTALVDKSLLQPELGMDDEPRFGMLETIREYALEQLAESGEAEALRRRHATYYLWLAEAAASEFGGRRQAAWLAQLTHEHHNLHAALQWALETGEIDIVARFLVALRTFYAAQGYLSEGAAG